MVNPNGHPALTFLKVLYQNCESGTVNLRFKASDKTGKAWNEFIGVNDLKTIPTKLGKNRKNHCWFGPALRNGSSGKKEGILSIPGPWLDHDRVTEAVDKEIHELLMPTLVTQTSSPEKKHYYWVFKEPCNRNEISKIETINKRLVKFFGGCNGSWEAGHMMRIPGTYNVKPDYPTPFECKLLEVNESRQYNPSDFDILPPTESSNEPPSEDAKANYGQHLTRIMQCEFLKHCDRDRQTLSEPDWYAMIGVLCRETGGPDLIHSLSKGYPGYSPKETIEKILHAMNDGGPATCQRIKTMYDCGRDCGVKSPAALAYKEPDLEKGKTQPLSYLNLDLPSSLEISRLEIRVEWIVDNLIPKESISLLHSIGGVGKSYLMFGMGQAVADGKLFFGLNVKQMPVFYIDFENPLPEISDRMKKIGGSQNMKIWHLGHNPAPVRFDGDEWEIYKSFPRGLFIIDSLRSSHLLEENSSKDAAFVMARLKETRALGNTIILIHHENKVGGYRGSTAWFDLSDHILKFSRVKKIGSDEDAEEDNFDLPIRLGLGGKSRFSSALDLKPMYFKFEDHQLCCANDPEEEILNQMADLLNPLTPPNQTEFQKLVKQNLGIGQKDFRKLLRKGEDRKAWYVKRSAMGNKGNKLEYFRV